MNKPYNHGASDIWDSINISKESLAEFLSFLYNNVINNSECNKLSEEVEAIEKFLLTSDGTPDPEKFRACLYIFYDSFNHLNHLKYVVKALVKNGLDELGLDEKKDSISNTFN